MKDRKRRCRRTEQPMWTISEWKVWHSRLAQQAEDRRSRACWAALSKPGLTISEKGISWHCECGFVIRWPYPGIEGGWMHWVTPTICDQCGKEYRLEADYCKDGDTKNVSSVALYRDQPAECRE